MKDPGLDAIVEESHQYRNQSETDSRYQAPKADGASSEAKMRNGNMMMNR